MHGCFSKSCVYFIKCVMSAGVAVNVERISDEITRESMMVMCVS